MNKSNAVKKQAIEEDRELTKKKKKSMLKKKDINLKESKFKKTYQVCNKKKCKIKAEIVSRLL